MEITINKEDVMRYFKEIISDEEIWDGTEEQIQIAATMLHGALAFANIFDLITDDEKNNLMFGITEE